MRGDGVPHNSYQGLEWLRKAGEQNLVDAQLLLGRLYLSGVAEMGSDAAEAQQWLSRAAAQGSAQARKLLARLKKSRTTSRHNTKRVNRHARIGSAGCNLRPPPITGTGATTAGSATDVRWCHAHQCASPPPIPFVLIFGN